MKSIRDMDLKELKVNYSISPLDQKSRILSQARRAINAGIRKYIRRQKRNGVYVSLGSSEASEVYFEVRVEPPVTRKTRRNLLCYARRCPFKISFPNLDLSK